MNTIFVSNIRYLNLVQEVSGTDFVRTIDDIIDRIPSSRSGDESVPPAIRESSSSPEYTGATNVANRTNAENRKIAREPSLHIDVQVHIDATASAEQIDQVFASMAKHLYGRSE